MVLLFFSAAFFSLFHFPGGVEYSLKLLFLHSIILIHVWQKAVEGWFRSIFSED